jgi:acetolactate synthase-1/2/3 large subunit
MNGAQALVRILENHGVTHIFGIPGAKIDSVFIALLDSSIELVLCRHEQNAAFMAQAVGKITGKIGVCLVTSGPGVTNLVTGLATATSEGDPVLAIGGEVSLDDRYKHTHQCLESVSVLRSVTKFAQSALSVHDLPEILGNAIRAAERGRRGAAFLGLPKDIGLADFPGDIDLTWGRYVPTSLPARSELEGAIDVINSSRKPIVLAGMEASDPSLAKVLEFFFKSSGIPYCSTLQGPGSWAAPQNFVGRVGIFCNQPSDHLLNTADCVITIGFDPIELDPSLWNQANSRPIVFIDVEPAKQDRAFLPSVELIGNLTETLRALLPLIKIDIDPAFLRSANNDAVEIAAKVAEGATMNGMPVHPLRVIHELKQVITPETTVAVDTGSHYIWMSRYLPVEYSRQLLVSNGQQTLGVSIPWAMAANLARPGRPVISVSGDGGFLFTATELETAKRIGSRFVHLIWNSESYDMVAIQEQDKYGRTAGVKLGYYDVEYFAKSFGCKGYRITKADQLGDLLKESLAQPVPVLIDIPIDYSQNIKLMKNAAQDFIH